MYVQSNQFLDQFKTILAEPTASKILEKPLTRQEKARCRWPKSCATCVHYACGKMTWTEALPKFFWKAAKRETFTAKLPSRICLLEQRKRGESVTYRPNHRCHRRKLDPAFGVYESAHRFMVSLLDDYDAYLARGGRDFKKLGKPKKGKLCRKRRNHRECGRHVGAEGRDTDDRVGVECGGGDFRP